MKMFEFTAKNIRNGNIRNYLVPARKIKLSAWRPNWRFLTPDAHCTYYYNGQLPVDIILGIPHVGRTADTEEFAQNTRDNLQIAFELARRNLTERADKQNKIANLNRTPCSNLDRKYSCTNHTRTRMVPTQNCYYRGEAHTSFALNYHRWCIEYDLRTTPEKCPSTSPT